MILYYLSIKHTMSFGNLLRQTVGAARRAGAKVESAHRALS